MMCLQRDKNMFCSHPACSVSFCLASGFVSFYFDLVSFAGDIFVFILLCFNLICFSISSAQSGFEYATFIWVWYHYVWFWIWFSLIFGEQIWVILATKMTNIGLFLLDFESHYFSSWVVFLGNLFFTIGFPKENSPFLAQNIKTHWLP